MKKLLFAIGYPFRVLIAVTAFFVLNCLGIESGVIMQPEPGTWLHIKQVLKGGKL